MKTDTINFLEALLFNADAIEADACAPDIDAELRPLMGKTVYDFTPAFIAAVDKFVSGFRDHLEQTGFPMDKLDASERSFGGNVYWSLSGAGVGFFDDREEVVCKLHERLKTWAGAYRFEDLASNLDVGEDGKIDLPFIPSAIGEYREKYFGVPVGEPSPKGETNIPAFTPGPWTIEGQGILQHPVSGGSIITTRIGTGGYGEIELVDGTNEPEGNKYLIAAAPEMLDTLLTIEAMIGADPAFDTLPCNVRAAYQKARQAIAKVKGGQ